MLVSTVWLGLIGGLDDYIKVFRHNKEGLKGRFKIVGQVGSASSSARRCGFARDRRAREGHAARADRLSERRRTVIESVQRNVVVSSESLKTTQTTIPFVKNNEFDYGWLTGEEPRHDGFSTCW